MAVFSFEIADLVLGYLATTPGDNIEDARVTWRQIQDNITNKITSTTGYNEGRILEKLDKDGYITTENNRYRITQDGDDFITLLGGYSFRYQKMVSAEREENLAKRIGLRSYYIQIAIMVWTGMAALYYSLEILNHWFRIYPVSCH